MFILCCDTLQVLLSTKCTQSCLNCCFEYEDELVLDDVFFAPGTEDTMMGLSRVCPCQLPAGRDEAHRWTLFGFIIMHPLFTL